MFLALKIQKNILFVYEQMFDLHGLKAMNSRWSCNVFYFESVVSTFVYSINIFCIDVVTANGCLVGLIIINKTIKRNKE